VGRRSPPSASARLRRRLPKIGGLKGFTDGIMGNSTARFYEPYLHTGERGEWRDSTNTGARAARAAACSRRATCSATSWVPTAAGLWPQVHAIGDEAIDTLLTLYEQASARTRRASVASASSIRR
jgi:predicted amidohydrolase YtcJ